MLVAALFLGSAAAAGAPVSATGNAASVHPGCSGSGPGPCGVHPTPPSALTLHDLLVTSFNVSVVEGRSITFYATLPAGVTSTHFHWYLGDGTTANTSTGSVTHTYATAGLYTVYAKATGSDGNVYDNTMHLLEVGVTASFAGDTYGNLVQLAGSVGSNTSTSVGATTILRPGNAATVSASVFSGPENVLSAYGSPSFALGSTALPYATLSAESLHASGKSTVTVTFAKSTPFGVYTLGYADPTATPVNGSTVTAWSNYTFTFVVGKHLGGAGLPVTTSPHPGTLVADEFNSITSIDPAVAYGGAGTEVVSNVYETLVDANGTAAGPEAADYDPGLAVCVPGSPQCTDLFGSSLIAGSGEYYTFVINSAARFYDNATGASFGVYPSDVMFSVARLLAYANLPGVEVYPGWILAQALLPAGNSSWDGDIHAPFNNTPQTILDSMYVNDSRYCPSSAMSLDHGCITFVADGGGHDWPLFLALVSSTWGASVESCGWFSAPSQGAGLPGWHGPSGAGDRPCLLPGGTNTTSAKAFQRAVAALSPTRWDTYERAAGLYYPVPVPGVQWSAVGSGPYYVVSVNGSTGYELKWNPAFARDPYCTWSTCEPTAGTPYGTVEVNFVPLASTMLADLASGRADLAILPQSNFSEVDDLVASGQASFGVEPALTIFEPHLDLEYSPANAKMLFHRSFSAPSDFLTDDSLRQFLLTSYPSATTENSEGISAGIAEFYTTGGVIPQHLSDYYPTNISWPLGTPDPDPSDVGGAAWWWAQATDPASPEYDPELASCTSSSPCTFPIAYEEGTTDNSGFPLWASTVVKLSGGTVKPVVEAVNFSAVLDFFESGPGTNPAGVWAEGWVPDYADPTDYVTPYYLPNSIYTYEDAVEQALAPLDGPSCSASIAYWAALATPIPEGCQGAAYDAMVSALSEAAFASLGANRVLLYNEVEHVAEALALYGPNQQDNFVREFAPWINPSSLTDGPVLASGSVDLWFDVRATGVAATPLTVRGVVAEPNPATVDSPVAVYSLATGGTGGYVYTYATTGDFDCASSPNATDYCVPLSTGTFLVNVTVTDATGQQVTSTSTSVTVNFVERTRARRADLLEG